MIYQYHVEWVNALPQTPFGCFLKADSRKEADKLLEEELKQKKEKYFNYKILSTTIQNKENERNEN